METLEKKKLIWPGVQKTGFLSCIPNRAFYKETRVIFYTSVLTTLITTFNVFVDNFIAGHLGEASISGIGMATFSLGILNLFVGGVSMVFARTLAQTLNTGRHADSQMCWDLILFLTTGFGIAGAIIFYIFGGNFMHLQVGNNPLVIARGEEYMRWGIIAFVINAYSFHYEKLFGAIGKTKMIFYVAIAVVIVNIAVSMTLTYGLHWGVTGTAIGTLISVLVGLLTKIFFAVREKEIKIRILPHRFIFVKRSSWFFMKETWYYIPFEGIWWVLNFAATSTLTRNFTNGEFVYSIGSPFWYTFLSATGSIPILNKYLGTALGQNEEELAYQYSKVIVSMSVIRMIPIVIFLFAFAWLVPYLRIYDVSREVLFPGQIFLVYCSFTSMLGILYVIGYICLSFGGHPKTGMVFDIASKAFVFIIIFVTSRFTSDIYLGIFAFVIASWITDFVMVFFAIRRRFFKSLYKENQISLISD